MGLQFHETRYGKKFFEAQLPELIEEVGRLADAIETYNKITLKKEKEEND